MAVVEVDQRTEEEYIGICYVRCLWSIS